MLGRSAAEARLEEEMRFHLELETERRIRAGLSEAEARRRALLAFGGVDKHVEQHREGRRIPVLDSLVPDVRYAVRALRRGGGFAVVAIATLALGIGASVAMFSVLRGVLLRELPVRAQDDVVVVWTRAPSRATDHLPLVYADMSAYGEQTRVFESVAGVAYQGAVEQVLLDGGEPLTVGMTWVTGNFFGLLGTAPVHGRPLRAADDVPGAAPVLVISHGLWQRHFGGDPAAVGRTLEWEGGLFTVVGVLPAGFAYPQGVDVWAPVLPAFPATLEPQASAASAMVFDLVGRLAPGAGVEAAVAEFAAYLRSTDGQRAEAYRGLEPVVTPLAELITGDVRRTLWLAAVAVALLLLIACVNVANLLLIRGSTRTQELAIRTALGAGRRRLIRQLLTESGVLATAGGVLGVLLAYAAVAVLVAVAPPELPRRELIGVDGRVLVFAVVVTGATALLAGLLPAVLSATGDLGTWLRGGRSVAESRHGGRLLRHGLVVGQVALAMLVVTGAGLLVRSLVLLQGADMGFDAERLLIVQTQLPPQVTADRAQLVTLQEAMVARIAAVPGVAGAASLPRPPFSGQTGWTAMYSTEGQPPAEQATNPWVNFEVVGPEYFGVLGIALRRGRAFTAADREAGVRVAVVSEAVAQHSWPGQDPIGRRIKLGPPDGPAEWHTVVGVAGETRYRELASPHPTLYLPIRQFGGPVPLSLAVRTSGDAATMIPQLRAALTEVHPDLLLVRGGAMPELLAAPLARPRFSALLLATFGAITLLLAVVGIYGALAATVRLRSRELGIRLALGARSEEVRTLVLGQGLRLALLGSALGSAAALLGARVLESMLYGIGPTDPLTFLAVIGLMLGAAALACYVPARRAARLDPVTTLRAD